MINFCKYLNNFIYIYIKCRISGNTPVLLNQNLHFNKLLRRYVFMIKFEKHCSGLFRILRNILMLFQVRRIYCGYTGGRSLEEKDIVSTNIQPDNGELGYHYGNGVTLAICLFHLSNNSRFPLLPILVLCHSVTIFIPIPVPVCQ